MPKHVDHDQRRDELADAVWRLVVREGVEAASLRRVAAEAGWSVGSVRHYFATQHELLTFAMELVVTRATARLQTTPPGPDAPATAAALLGQLLPLDDERRAEMQVWLAFSTRAAVDPALR
ncbi:MAG TPA: TetR family transcriptional regulator C-terminal domain-containing protein, partial [Solirubrobacteraceae bacterium]|nr:TetR family transcriptional regulator C-terminal domain-containing protein [Solirubrobacteraceae bacterium]